MAVLGKVMITNGGSYQASKQYPALTNVEYNGSSYLTLKAVNGITPTDDGINYQLMARGFTGNEASEIEIVDRQGLIPSGTQVNVQSLVDVIADKVKNDLLSKESLANNVTTTQTGYALDARQGKVLNDNITKINSDLYVGSSNKQISLTEINNPSCDMHGYIGSLTAEAIGLKPLFYSVYQTYNDGNPTQLFIPIAYSGDLYVRGFRRNIVTYLNRIDVVNIFKEN